MFILLSLQSALIVTIIPHTAAADTGPGLWRQLRLSPVTGHRAEAGEPAQSQRLSNNHNNKTNRQQYFLRLNRYYCPL